MIKTSALNTRLFKLLCEDFGSQHVCLLYHTEVRWLSRGNTTRRLFELRDELLCFFKEKQTDFQKDLEDDEFVSKLAYLSDIFGELNKLNLSFQGPNSNVSDFTSKLQAFVRKLELWASNIEAKQYGMFELLSGTDSVSDTLLHDIVDHLTRLREEVEHYFPDRPACIYLKDPFSIDPEDLPVGTGEQESIIDIQADQTAKKKHGECGLLDFWISMSSSYPVLAQNVIPQLLVFPSTWECEQGFSSLMAIKSKTRNRLDRPDHDFRCAVSKLQPQIDQLVANKQLHTYH